MAGVLSRRVSTSISYENPKKNRYKLYQRLLPAIAIIKNHIKTLSNTFQNPLTYSKGPHRYSFFTNVFDSNEQPANRLVIKMNPLFVYLHTVPVLTLNWTIVKFTPQTRRWKFTIEWKKKKITENIFTSLTVFQHVFALHIIIILYRSRKQFLCTNSIGPGLGRAYWLVLLKSLRCRRGVIEQIEGLKMYCTSRIKYLKVLNVTTNTNLLSKTAGLHL